VVSGVRDGQQQQRDDYTGYQNLSCTIELPAKGRTTKRQSAGCADWTRHCQINLPVLQLPLMRWMGGLERHEVKAEGFNPVWGLGLRLCAVPVATRSIPDAPGGAANHIPVPSDNSPPIKVWERKRTSSVLLYNFKVISTSICG
jgi:hypothetical protein